MKDGKRLELAALRVELAARSTVQARGHGYPVSLEECQAYVASVDEGLARLEHALKELDKERKRGGGQ